MLLLLLSLCTNADNIYISFYKSLFPHSFYTVFFCFCCFSAHNTIQSVWYLLPEDISSLLEKMAVLLTSTFFKIFELHNPISKGKAISFNLFSTFLEGLARINADSANVSTILSKCFSVPKFIVSLYQDRRD